MWVGQVLSAVFACSEQDKHSQSASGSPNRTHTPQSASGSPLPGDAVLRKTSAQHRTPLGRGVGGEVARAASAAAFGKGGLGGNGSEQNPLHSGQRLPKHLRRRASAPRCVRFFLDVVMCLTSFLSHSLRRGAPIGMPLRAWAGRGATSHPRLAQRYRQRLRPPPPPTLAPP